VQSQVLLDLDYREDSSADTDMNFVMDDRQRFIELQGTAENEPFSEDELQAMTTLAKKGIAELIALQSSARKTRPE
jgi:ribonuclease PH